MLPTSYGLFGSILSTDGMLSLDKSYVIGMPRIGQKSGMGVPMNSSRVMFRRCLRADICFHNDAKGADLRFSRCFSSNRSLLLARYSFMYSRCCSLVCAPFSRFRRILASDWHDLQMFGNLPFRGVKSLSGFSIPHFVHRRIIRTLNDGLTDYYICKSVIKQLCKDSKQNGGCERKGHASRAALSLPGMNAGVSRAER